VVLRLTVEVDGQISNAVVWQSSGNGAYDDAIACLVTTQIPPLDPATVAGDPIPTDMVLLEAAGYFIE
jgi:hypothetical protein